MSEQRKLATIMAVDVAGYSRAAEADESAAAETIARLREALDAIIAPLSGRIFNTAGDGVMIEFPAASSGVEAALRLLEETEAARDLPRVRIGLHLGEVIVTPSGDLLGHGVNVAARLQALAEPGTAVVSKAVQAQLRRLEDITLTPHGKVQLDKMSERIDVFTLAPDGRRGFARIGWRRARTSIFATGIVVLLALIAFVAWRTLAPPSEPPEPVLAIMLFQAASAEAEPLAESFSVGLHEMLSFPGVRMISTTSSFPLRAEARNPRAVRTQLGADFLIDGTIAQSGERVVVTAELIDARTGVQVWRDRFQGEPSRLYAVQNQINQSARGAMLIVSEAAARGRSVDPTALRFFMNAWAPNPEGEDIYASHGGAIDSYRRAVELQPDFLLAWSDMSRVASIYQYRGPNPEARRAAHEQGRIAAERAYALTPENPFNSILRAQFVDRNGARADYQAHLDRAIELGRAQPLTMSLEVAELLRFGRVRDATPIVARVREIDQYGLFLIDYPDPAELEDTPARFEEAMAELGASAPDPPTHWREIHLGWLALRNRPRADAALVSFSDAVTQIARNEQQMSAPFAEKSARWLSENRALHDAVFGGRPAIVRAELARRADVSAPDFRHDVSAVEFYNYVLPGLALVGGADAAYAAWEARLSTLPRPDGHWVAYEPLEHETYIFNQVMFKPYYRPLQSDPRFWRMIARLEFPDWWLTDPRWPPDFCNDASLGYACSAAAAEAFAAR